MSSLSNVFERMISVPINDERPWVVFAACRDSDPKIFFPTTREEVRQALSVCGSCPVRPECLDYAFEADERFGIWGGLEEKERRKVVRQLRRTG